MTITVSQVPQNALHAVLPKLAELRIAVFRDWPYLYDGSLEYEADYLRTYAQSDGAIVVGAWDGSDLVGAATGAPLEEHEEDFALPLARAGYDLGTIFYCGESVLLPQYRGQGIGHAFFDHREAQARKLGRSRSSFCAVIRPDTHPMRPSDYRPLDPFWRKRGYEMLPGVAAEFGWKDVGEPEETQKPMSIWMRDL